MSDSGGRALQGLSALRDAYASGELAWDQVRPATRFVTPDDDADQAARLPGHSAAQIALMARQARPLEDRGFGCGRKIRQVHHITHWADGGDTNLDNLVGLCWEHHRLVHEGGWTIRGDANDEISFISPDGRRRLPSRPRPRRPDLDPRRAAGHSDPDPP